MVKIDDLSFAEVWRKAHKSRSRHLRSWFLQGSRVLADKLAVRVARARATLAATNASNASSRCCESVDGRHILTKS